MASPISEAERECIVQIYIGTPEGRLKLICSTLQPVREAMDEDPNDPEDCFPAAIRLLDLVSLLRRVMRAAELEGQELGIYPTVGALKVLGTLTVGRMADLIDVRLDQHREDPEVDRLMVVSEVMRS
ncbi:hypothetical protein LCGC14_2381070 [marine sediment metagenome]|uniref:Uncharacterized protein n=1 Tax=marine sediment metagenome TaxID=412755 RepID=A0A0F9CN39_9ZZZZ